MDTVPAFAMGEAHRNDPLKVFDWVKAAKLLKEKNPIVSEAGLATDWEYTGGEIWKNGAPVKREDTYTFLGSTWAIPQILIDGEYVDCWILQTESPGGKWDPHTYWPNEALAVLGITLPVPV